MDSEAQAVYSIGAVARMLDIPASTLRAWEERYGLISPARSEGSQRLYSRVQVEQLRFVKAQIESGMSSADAHRLLAQGKHAGRLPVPEPPSSQRRLVLIAERDPYAADLAEHYLRAEGYDVVVALDATQARLHFQERSPDVVLVDLLISGGAGFRLVRDFASAGGAKVVVLSVVDSEKDALDAGARAFIRKPVESRRLLATVSELVAAGGGSRMRKQPATSS